MSGHIKLFRKLQENKIWNDKPFTRGQAWVDLLLSASWKDNVFHKRGIEVVQKTGTVATSMKGLSARWGWSIGKTRRFLLYLENENQIENQIDNVTTLITIVNWEEYQSTETKTETRRKPDGNQTETIKKVKEVKHIYGAFRHVRLTEKEAQKLRERFNGQFDQKIKELDEGIEMKGYKYKSHYLAILKWDKNKETKQNKSHSDLNGYV